MYFAVIEAIPTRKTEASRKYGGAHVACWINVTEMDRGREAAIALILAGGWRTKAVVEERFIYADNYAPGDNGLQYFEQALVDGEVCVIYTSPKRNAAKRPKID